MFTGIIEEIGSILVKKQHIKSVQWAVKATPDFMQDIKIGDSISVAGVCQTVTDLSANSFSFYSSPTTVQKTNLLRLSVQSPVNLEKALAIGQRLGGHFVYGHVEGLGQIVQIDKEQETIRLKIQIPKELKLLIVQTGSITVDGVSLTVSDYFFPHITLQIIPHTWQHTTLSLLQIGSLVNLETDPLAKYILQMVQEQNQNPNSLQEALLKNGFIK